jgi:2-methylcitrate dehydratase PrpD
MADEIPEFETLSFIRTSRRICDGRLYVPDDVKADVYGSEPLGNAPVSRGHVHGSNFVNGVKVDKSRAAAVNGAGKNSSNGEPLETTSITKQLAEMVAETRPQDLNDQLIVKLKGLLLDYIGVGAAGSKVAESSFPFYKAVCTLVGKSNGTATVLGASELFPPPYAALLNAAYAHSLDFDDTHAGGALHPGASVISAALAQAETDPSIGSNTLLTALAVGYEVTCRLGIALGTGGYQRGFHNTSTASIFGAVAAIAELKGLGRNGIENAFGLAISKAAGSMQYLANESWNRRLHPGFAAHDAFVCVALAEAVVIGAAEPIEGKFGLLSAYSETSARDMLTQSLGP